MQLTNEFIEEKVEKINEKQHHIMIIKDKILKKEMEDNEFQNVMQTKEKCKKKFLSQKYF